jgi:hypothetical protein
VILVGRDGRIVFEERSFLAGGDSGAVVRDQLAAPAPVR